MTRIRQFAKDMGISYNKANSLVQKGRKKRDGGSTILENTMNNAKMMKANKGKITKLRKETSPKAKMGNFRNIVNAATSGKMSPEKAEKAIRKIVASKNTGGVNLLKNMQKAVNSKEFQSLLKDPSVLKKKPKLVKPKIKKAMGGLKDIPPENKGLPKLPKEVRNKMGFKKKGGTMKMMGGGSMNMMPRKLMNKGGVARGGGAATSGTGFKGVY